MFAACQAPEATSKHHIRDMQVLLQALSLVIVLLVGSVAAFQCSSNRMEVASVFGFVVSLSCGGTPMLEKTDTPSLSIARREIKATSSHVVFEHAHLLSGFFAGRGLHRNYVVAAYRRLCMCVRSSRTNSAMLVVA